MMPAGWWGSSGSSNLNRRSLLPQLLGCPAPHKGLIQKEVISVEEGVGEEGRKSQRPRSFEGGAVSKRLM